MVLTKTSIVALAAGILLGGCAGVTSPVADKVALYEDEASVPGGCRMLGEVSAGVCANTTPCPAEVMRKELREAAYNEFSADAVLLTGTSLSGTRVVGHGLAYRCGQ